MQPYNRTKSALLLIGRAIFVIVGDGALVLIVSLYIIVRDAWVCVSILDRQELRFELFVALINLRTGAIVGVALQDYRFISARTRAASEP